MNEAIQKQVAALLESANQAGTDLLTLMKEKAPELYQQILAWGICQDLVGLLISTALFAFVSFFLLRHYFKDRNGCLLGIWGCFVFLYFLIDGCFLADLLKIRFAPDLFVIDYVKNLFLS